MAITMSKIDAEPSNEICANSMMSICGSFLYVLVIFTSLRAGDPPVNHLPESLRRRGLFARLFGN